MNPLKPSRLGIVVKIANEVSRSTSGIRIYTCMGIGRQFRMVGHFLDQADSSMPNKHHEVGLIASSEFE